MERKRAVGFDTQRMVNRLRAGGMPELQAAALVEAFREAFAEALSGFATKEDIKEVRAEIKDVRAEIEQLSLKMEARMNRQMWIQLAAIATLLGIFRFFSG